MPTESSVVANLIRDLNTRRLPEEPSDSFLFQPAPLDRAARGTQQPIRTLIGHESAHAAITAPAKAKAPRAARAKAVRHPNDGRWWQFAVATILLGGWVYLAGMLDASEPTKTATFAMPTLPTIAPIAAPAPAPIVTPVVDVPPPAVEEVVTAPPVTPETPVTTVAEQAPPKKQRRGPAKLKRKVEKRVTPKIAPVAEVTEPPAPPPPKPAVAAPARPAVQSMDSENPLK